MNFSKAPPIILLFLLLNFESAFAQSRIYTGLSDGPGIPPRWAVESDFDGDLFVFCRGYYEKIRNEGFGITGWYVDYPGADFNFSVRLSELTNVKIKLDSQGNPLHVVVSLDSPLLFNCPVLFLSDAGTIGLKASEIENLRKYLDKGGFLWADDSWGSAALRNWENQIRQVLPADKYLLFDIPMTHPILHQVYDISEILQVPNIGFWANTQGQTSERGPDSEKVYFKGIEDEKERLIVVMTHNTDIADTWEREGSIVDGGREFFNTFSLFGYKFGINIFIYALTH